MLKKISQLARDAGYMIMEFYSSNKERVQILYKSDKSPVTNVDIKVSNFICDKLSSITPNIPIVSEEMIPHVHGHKRWYKYWLIDPLDGTKEFLKDNGEFTVNISLIDNGIPVLGVIYAPFFNTLYYAFENTAWKENHLGMKKKIYVLRQKIPTVIHSRSHIDSKLKFYIQKIKNCNSHKMGSSLKFCYLAEGKAQIYPRFNETYIWDTAAGHAILNAAGGMMCNWSGEKLNYFLSSSLHSFMNPGFYAASSMSFLDV